MKIAYASIYVDDQMRALDFYTTVLGFREHTKVPIGEDFWLTVVSSEHPDGPELQLDPGGHPATKPYREALKADGIPMTMFAVEDVTAEYERLTAAGVAFTTPPTDVGAAIIAVFDDTCGNLIQIITQK